MSETMKVTIDNLWLCLDCMNNEQATATSDGLTRLGFHVVPNFDSETGDGIRELSLAVCDCCKTPLAGYRARFAIVSK